LERFTYNRIGTLKSTSDGSGTRQYIYNAQCLLDTELLDSSFYTGGASIKYAYDGQGRQTALTVQNGAASFTQGYTYTPATGQLQDISAQISGNTNTTKFTFAYATTTGRPTHITSGLYRRSMDYAPKLDALAAVTTSWNSQTVGFYAMEFDPQSGLPLKVRHGGAGTAAANTVQSLTSGGQGFSADLHYDKRQRLLGVKNIQPIGTGLSDPNARLHEWTYDGRNNRLEQTVNTLKSVYSPAASGSNQYTKVTEGARDLGLTYEALGQLSKLETMQFGYDHEERVTSLTKDTKTWQYTYDHLGRRVRKSGPTEDVFFFWSGWTLNGVSV
jgi:YD repeat-containing protein